MQPNDTCYGAGAGVSRPEPWWCLPVRPRGARAVPQPPNFDIVAQLRPGT